MNLLKLSAFAALVKLLADTSQIEIGLGPLHLQFFETHRGFGLIHARGGANADLRVGTLGLFTGQLDLRRKRSFELLGLSFQNAQFRGGSIDLACEEPLTDFKFLAERFHASVNFSDAWPGRLQF